MTIITPQGIMVNIPKCKYFRFSSDNKHKVFKTDESGECLAYYYTDTGELIINEGVDFTATTLTVTNKTI